MKQPVNTSMDPYPKIIELIERKMGRYRFELTPETRLETDLGMTGDDAFEFIQDFSDTFHVDLSDFHFMKHFAPECDGASIEVLRLFLSKEDRAEPIDLTIGELMKAVATGKLDDSVIQRRQ